MRSPFASWMDRLALTDKTLKKNEADPMLKLLADKGIEHETDFLQTLIDQHGEKNVAQIIGDKKDAAQKTADAIKAGYSVIFQAYLERDSFKGYADFLIKKSGRLLNIFLSKC